MSHEQLDGFIKGKKKDIFNFNHSGCFCLVNATALPNNLSQICPSPSTI